MTEHTIQWRDDRTLRDVMASICEYESLDADVAHIAARVEQDRLAAEELDDLTRKTKIMKAGYKAARDKKFKRGAFAVTITQGVA